MSESLPDWPAMMRVGLAAQYCDISVGAFEQEVATGRLPGPVQLGGENRWSRTRLNEAFSALHAGSTSNARSPKDPPAVSPTRAYTVATLASFWECDEGLVRKLIHSGQLECFRIGKLLRITPAAIARYEATQMEMRR